MWTTGAILYRLSRIRPTPPEITRLPTDAEALAQGRNIGPVQRRKQHELPTLVHDRNLPPSHPDPPLPTGKSVRDVSEHLSTMSPG